MRRRDNLEKQRLQSRNDLEDFIYQTQSELSKNENLISAILFQNILTEILYWINNTSENCKKEKYEQLLEVLKHFDVLSELEKANDIVLWNLVDELKFKLESIKEACI